MNASETDRAGVRRCPDCGEPLTESEVRDAGVVVDVCSIHGTWFDPREMRAVIEAIVRRTPPAVDPEVDRVIAREAILGRHRPPESYRVPHGFTGTRDFDDVVSDILDRLIGRNP